LSRDGDETETMTWNYRVVRYRDGTGYGLHEVHYDDEGEPWSMTQRPASFACDAAEGPEGIRDSLLAALVDTKQPVFDEPERWPGKRPS
jgi:hypothetical protein